MADNDEKKAAAGGEGGEAPARKSKSKLIIIIAAALVVLGGGGFGVYTFVLKKPPKDDVAEAKVQEKTPEQKLKELVGPMYPLQTFLVNIGDDGDNTRFLKTTLTLELTDDKVKDELDKRLAQVRDLILLDLSTKTFDEIKSVDGKYILRQELLDKINSILITGKVKNIYFTDFIVQ